MNTAARRSRMAAARARRTPKLVSRTEGPVARTVYAVADVAGSILALGIFLALIVLFVKWAASL